jgi:hypothetical protein
MLQTNHLCNTSGRYRKSTSSQQIALNFSFACLARLVFHRGPFMFVSHEPMTRGFDQLGRPAASRNGLVPHCPVTLHLLSHAQTH